MQVVDPNNSKQWVVLGTGGTIAGTALSASDHTGYLAAQLSVHSLMESLPGLREVLQGDSLQCEQVAQLDSKDMAEEVWQALARRCSQWLAQPTVGGVVITHGTDTLEETAWFLQQVLGTGKPVVLTCAMRPATALMSDGPQNLMDALAVVRDARAQGILVVCAGRIHSARAVQKVHPYRLDAFSSGDGGPLGWVEQGMVRWSGDAGVSAAHVHAGHALVRPVNQWPWVEMLHSHAGARESAVVALVAAGVQGLVVVGTGNGTVHQAMLPALSRAQSRGVSVRLTSRCAEGQMVAGPHALPVAPPGLNACKARISLMLDLMA
jgi:L-asparaginase